MNLMGLSDDILELVSEEVFRWRKRACGRELKWMWKKNRSGRRLLLTSIHSIHEGRLLFCQPDQSVLKISTIPNREKYYICGIRALPFSEYNYATGMIRYGISIKPSKKCTVGKIVSIGLRNEWKDFHHQTTDTIVRYLLDKDEDMI